jgi:RNA 2',3'-cyclic 3'-phosphodiesterase
MLNRDMRLFVALDIDDPIRERIRCFVNELQAMAPNVRWASPESLHITLKFIGEQPELKMSAIEAALAKVSAPSLRISFRGCGFFPAPKSARVFWIGIEAPPALAKLAGDIEEALATLGIEREKRAFSPHLTLARAKGGSGAPGRQKSDRSNQSFAGVQERLTEIPAQEFGTMTAREFFLYRSQLSSQGSRYTKIANFALSAEEA